MSTACLTFDPECAYRLERHETRMLPWCIHMSLSVCVMSSVPPDVIETRPRRTSLGVEEQHDRSPGLLRVERVRLAVGVRERQRRGGLVGEGM